MNFYWLSSVDPQPESWAFCYREATGLVQVSKVCKEHSCLRCGKFNELEMLRKPQNLPVFCKSKRDFVQTLDGVILVKQSFDDVVNESQLTGLKFVGIPQVKNYYACFVDGTAEFDAKRGSIRLLGLCDNCGRFREAVPWPSLASLTQVPTTDFVMIQLEKPRAAFHLLYASAKALLALTSASLTGFESTHVGRTDDVIACNSTPFENIERRENWHDQKLDTLERFLGKQHEMVSHSIVPFAIGGGLDLYYFEPSPSGTAIATLEISESPDAGPSNEVFKSFELVMFTEQKLNLDEARDESTMFGKAHARINAVLNTLAPYSKDTALNRFDTCEFPDNFEEIGGACLIFDAIGAQPSQQAKFGVMIAIEIQRRELEFARKVGGDHLIAKLKEAGIYPNSIISRESVV